MLPFIYGSSYTPGLCRKRMSPKGRFLLLAFVCCGSLVVYSTSLMMYARDIDPRYYSALNLYIKYNKYLNQPNSPFPGELKPFLPPINRQQQEQIRDVFFAATELLKQLGIPYFLTQGSLLGSYLYHNMIPWDEDLDVIVHVQHLDTIRAAFENDSIVTVNNVSLKLKVLGRRHALWKLYPVIERNFTNNFKNPDWPFLDMFPYTDNGTHLVQVKDPHHAFPKDKMFPIQWRPFEGSLQPVPCDTEYVLKDIMFQSTWSNPCVSRSYSHLVRNGMKHMTVPCEQIRKYYPYVNRTVLSDNKHVREIVTIDNTVVEISTFEIPTCGLIDNDQKKVLN